MNVYGVSIMYYKWKFDLIKKAVIDKRSTMDVYKIVNKEVKVSYRTIQRYLNLMVEKNILKVTNVKIGGNRNLYEVKK